ncbi:general secretion pathway protein GspB [Amphritea japonica]|uniref:General secretion pathway protein B n=1 Tax=Amphritea japonica ATCC BAA-1530 TaxID=1278309 RepID=A0A7R6SSV4_9GAMM|nr:general secretion pathway protein GspB [Amphritea japonica]BBB26744.1 general secretion pathway protein B [Amphritea japonica ATCC BAA-1530]
MSYILDALKKSDQERTSQPAYDLSQPTEEIEKPKAVRHKWLWIIPALLTANIFLLLWPETDTSITTVTNPKPGKEGLPPEPVTEELAEGLAQQPAKLSSAESKPVHPKLTHNNKSNDSLPISSIATVKPVTSVSRYHRDPFAPLPGRTKPLPAIAPTPTKPQPKPLQQLAIPNLEKLNRSLLNQALIEQLTPLRQEQSTSNRNYPDVTMTAATSSIRSLPQQTAEQPFQRSHNSDEIHAQVPLYQELEPALQQDIPELNISVHIFADIPEQRMARVNGIMARQGQQLDNDLTLEEIRPDYLILSFRGERFRLKR